MSSNEDIKKIIKLTGERARLDAKIHGTYVVYSTSDGEIIKEYADGVKETISHGPSLDDA